MTGLLAELRQMMLLKLLKHSRMQGRTLLIVLQGKSAKKKSRFMDELFKHLLQIEYETK
jgi:hypothetical protein